MSDATPPTSIEEARALLAELLPGPEVTDPPAPPPDLEPRLYAIRDALGAHGDALARKEVASDLAVLLLPRLGRMPNPEAREWLRFLRPHLAAHEMDPGMVLLAGQAAWIHGSLAGTDGFLEEAVACFEEADALLRIPRVPAEALEGLSRATLLQQLGDCLLELNRLDEAEARYAEARRDPSAGPSDAFALAWGLGRCHFFQERYPEAFRELRAARKAFDHAEPRWIRSELEKKSAYELLAILRDDLESLIEECRPLASQAARRS